MRTKTNLDTKKSLDASFKTFIKDKYILSTILMGCVSEFREMTMEETIACLDVKEGCTEVKGRPTEFFTASGERIEVDSVFEIRLPNNDKIGLIIGIEGQAKIDTGYPILKRASYYAASLIANQKGKEFEHDNYGDLQKVYTIWCILNPRAGDRDTVLEYSMKGGYMEPFSSRNSVPECDMMDIILINMSGSHEDDEGDHSKIISHRTEVMMDVLKTVFSRMDGKDKKRILEENYMISVSDTISEAMEDISMTMTWDDLIQGTIESSKEDGFIQGRTEGKAEGRIEGKIEGKAELILTFMKKQGVSLEEALDIFELTSEERESVRQYVLKTSGNRSYI